jgi:hypothetical protein
MRGRKLNGCNQKIFHAKPQSRKESNKTGFPQELSVLIRVIRG